MLLTLLTLAVPASASASSSQRTLFEAPRELLSGDAALRAQTLDEIRGFGVRWLRVVLYWKGVAPGGDRPGVPRVDERDPASYDWSRYDALVQDARARGMRLLLTVSGPVPRWATRDRADDRTHPSAVRFGRFMEAAGRHFGEVVDHWSIWNEPNHPAFLRPQWTRTRSGAREATSARIYRQLFREGEAGLQRAGQDRDTVLFGELAPRGTGSVVHPITFFLRALCLDARWRQARGCGELDADGVAHHAYTTRQGPFYVPPSPNDVTIGVLSRLTRAMDRAGRADALPRGLRLWLTEFGIQSKPDPFLGVSETAQAEHRAISERIAMGNPRVAAFSQYLMRDDEPKAGVPATQRYSGFESGLRAAAGKPKRAYEGFRLPLVADRERSTTTLWGIVRPAGGPTTVTVERQERGSSVWRRLATDRTDARGRWSTTTAKREGRRYRVRWTAPDGTVLTGPLTRSYAGR
ncbi:hypothetical protein [Conexibacter sp. SYSU D00693]|uniref:hypothetical protein n=1 Tax=Conexibacter sp. SYSU D00693 TaxID=2812560 RepID=UPI00196A34BF|nr:hypothetical protein [Conexibacter sp. SYSU D00693]